MVFVIMSIYTSAIFTRRGSVESRALLGFCAVISVLLSLMTGYGLMFVIGVPMSSMTQILPVSQRDVKERVRLSTLTPSLPVHHIWYWTR